jgi:hypothetical protein
MRASLRSALANRAFNTERSDCSPDNGLVFVQGTQDSGK